MLGFHSFGGESDVLLRGVWQGRANAVSWWAWRCCSWADWDVFWVNHAARLAG